MVGKNTTKSLSKKKLSLVKSEEICSYIFLSNLYKFTMLKCTVISP